MVGPAPGQQGSYLHTPSQWDLGQLPGMAISMLSLKSVLGYVTCPADLVNKQWCHDLKSIFCVDETF